MRAGGLGPGDLSDPLQSPQNMGCFGQDQLRTSQWTIREYRFRLLTVGSRIDSGRHQHRGIDNRRHVRSASRASRMRDAATRVPVVCLRRRTSCNHAHREGREAIRSSAPRRNSCMDWRSSAARAASRSRRSSETPLMVIRTGMGALCHPGRCAARSGKTASAHPHGHRTAVATMNYGLGRLAAPASRWTAAERGTVRRDRLRSPAVSLRRWSGTPAIPRTRNRQATASAVAVRPGKARPRTIAPGERISLPVTDMLRRCGTSAVRQGR